MLMFFLFVIRIFATQKRRAEAGLLPGKTFGKAEVLRGFFLFTDKSKVYVGYRTIYI